MDYYSELIDFYNKLNNKKIVLIEAAESWPSQQAIATAKQHIATAHSKANLPDGDPNRKVVGLEFPNGIWESKKKLIVWAMGHMNVTIEPPDLNNKYFKNFALLFDKGEVNSNNTETPKEVSVGKPVQGSQVANQSIIERMRLLVPEFQNKAKSGYWGTTKKRKDQTGSVMSTYLFGDRPQSLMRQIDDCIIMQKNASGIFSTGSVKGDTDLKHNVAVSLEKVLNLFIKVELTSEDKIALNSLIAITNDERVVIFDGMGANYGLVFSDGSKFLKNMIGNMESRFSKNQTDGKSIIEQKLSFLNGEVADSVSNQLGVLLEEIMGMVCLGNSKTPGSVNLRKHLMERYAKKMDETLGILNPLTSRWKDDNQDYATEFSAEMEALREIFKGGSEKLHRAIIGINTKALRARKPDRSISLGKITKLGRRADTREVYKTEADFIRAARASGLTINEGDINPITIEDAYGDQPENKLMRGLDVDYQLGQRVWCLEVSYKHYASKWDPKLGSSSSNSIVKFMQGGDLIQENENDKAAAQKHRNAMHNIGLNLSNSNTPDAKRITEYHKKQQDNIYLAIKKIRSGKIKVKGGKDKVEPFQEFTKTLMETLRRTSIYSELYGQIGSKGDVEAKRQLMLILSSIKAPESEEKSIEFKRNREHIVKNAIVTFLQNEILANHITYEGDDPLLKRKRENARDYLATKFMLAGGSNDDNMVVDMRLDGYSNHAVFPHNEAFSMVKAWREDKEGYKLERVSNGFRITGLGQDNFIEIADTPGKTENTSSESKVTIGEGNWEKMNRVPPSAFLTNSANYPKNVDNMILEYLNSQKIMLNNMFKVIAKDY